MRGAGTTPSPQGVSGICREKLLEEYTGAKLGDARLSARLLRMVGPLAMNPAESFPRQMGSDANLEGLYRWFSNDEFTADDVLAPHIEQTRARTAAARGTIRAVHDTTDLVFSGQREDLEIVEGEALGFFAHAAIAIGPGESREPLGLLGLRTYSRTDTKERRKLSRAEDMKRIRQTPRAEKTSHRWEALALQIAGELAGTIDVIHVMDQEADDYVIMASLFAKSVRFVIRADEGRRLKRGGMSIKEALAPSEQKGFRTIRLENRRKTKPTARYRQRDERDAQLVIQWGQITLSRTKDAQSDVPEVPLSVVRVWEPSPPEGEQAVDWTLLTTDAVGSLEEASEIVDHYRARWMIEEYFKALKTGCAIERRQIMTFAGLTKVLAVFIPIAWEMLRLRHLARIRADAPAEDVLTTEDLTILRALLKIRTDFVWPAHPTAHDALRGIAKLGGHLPRNGEPGWITIGRGFEDLVNARDVWRAARTEM